MSGIMGRNATTVRSRHVGCNATRSGWSGSVGCPSCSNPDSYAMQSGRLVSVERPIATLMPRQVATDTRPPRQGGDRFASQTQTANSCQRRRELRTSSWRPSQRPCRSWVVVRAFDRWGDRVDAAREMWCVGRLVTSSAFLGNTFHKQQLYAPLSLSDDHIRLDLLLPERR